MGTDCDFDLQGIDELAEAADHVVNSALKMLLWKDKHFMNWRKQQQQAARKEVPITGTQKSQARA